jgi:hypothetical protein
MNTYHSEIETEISTMIEKKTLWGSDQAVHFTHVGLPLMS